MKNNRKNTRKKNSQKIIGQEQAVHEETEVLHEEAEAKREEINDENKWKVIAVFAVIILLIVTGLYALNIGINKGDAAPAAGREDTATGTDSVPFSKDGENKTAGIGLKAAIGPVSDEGYQLKQVVCLSRHNIRSPLSGAGSALDTITPYSWYDWSSAPSELSLRGGTLETEMGQYFRKWLEDEGLFEANYRPDENKVRIYANSKQRTIATARFFSTGLLPTYNKDVEYHMEFDKMDPVFTPQLTFSSDDYKADAEKEVRELYGSVIESLSDNYELLSKVIDVENSEDYKSGKFTGFLTDDSVFAFEEGKEPSVSGSLKTACSISDALVLQYYEETDDKKAAFGNMLSTEEWEVISEIKDVYGDVLFTAPSVAVNVAHPLLIEIERELKTEGRDFTFLCGHDSNIGSVLAALRVEDYSLPGAIEKKTPIGSKLVISRWINNKGEEVMSFDMVYQTTDQLRGLSLLDTANPPAIYGLKIKGLTADENGCYKAEDVMKLLKEVIGEYDELLDSYEMFEAA